MPRQRTKASVKDTWKLKRWYNVISPDAFGKIQIGLTPADSEEKVIKRTVEITLFDITGDYSHVNTKLKFQVNSINEDNAYTVFKGHELLRDYLRSLTRRRSSKIAIILNVTTKDGAKVRVTSAVFTQYRCKTSQKQAIRKIMRDIIENKGSQLTFDEFVKLAVFSEQEGSLAQEITKAAKKICNVRKVEIIKQKVVELPKLLQSTQETTAS
ncbi:MAG: 30S ribosomal protein S3ae [Caldisphaera sp.]|uniref:30S ribosomal protein S3ae n=1 Tax=Caldisphaera sp. TaxID=2060322 RepID=UPI000CBC7502|nr:MAG: 30S ribosomal protein S3ae [Caldisphaera sp.]